jgi:hypothetical protein
MTIKELFIMPDTVFGASFATVENGEVKCFGNAGNKRPLITAVSPEGEVFLFSLTGYDQHKRKYLYSATAYTLTDGNHHFRYKMKRGQKTHELKPKLLLSSEGISAKQLVGQQRLVYTTDFFRNGMSMNSYNDAQDVFLNFAPMPTVIMSENYIHQLKREKNGYTYTKTGCVDISNSGLFPYTECLEPDEKYQVNIKNIKLWTVSDDEVVFYHDGVLSFFGKKAGKMLAPAGRLKALILFGNYLVIDAAEKERDSVSYIDLTDDIVPGNIHTLHTDYPDYDAFITTHTGHLVGTRFMLGDVLLSVAG